MSIASRLPAMTLPELTRLQANAERLAAGPSGRAQNEAAALLPLLLAEIEARRDGKKRVSSEPKPERARPLRAPSPPRPPKPKPAPKTASQKADDFLADVTSAINRR